MMCILVLGLTNKYTFKTLVLRFFPVMFLMFYPNNINDFTVISVGSFTTYLTCFAEDLCCQPVTFKFLFIFKAQRTNLAPKPLTNFKTLVYIV